MSSQRDYTPGLPTAVSGGDYRKSLEAIRDKLADELATAAGKDSATIGLALAKVLAELNALPTGREVSTVDRLRDELAERRAKAAGS